MRLTAFQREFMGLLHVEGAMKTSDIDIAHAKQVHRLYTDGLIAITHMAHLYLRGVVYSTYQSDPRYDLTDRGRAVVRARKLAW